MQERDGQRLLPELYFVPAELIDAERAQPHSQRREPNANVPLVWAQSLYVVAVLLQEGFIEAVDLKPLVRASGLGADDALHVVLLAENELVRARLTAQGIAAQTLTDAAPIQVRYAQELEAAYTELGHCAALGLSGRPAEDLGLLATSQAYTLGADTLVVLPAFFNRPGFYLTLDNRLLVDEINAEAAYVRRHWRGRGKPLLALLVAEPMLAAGGADELLGFLGALALDECAGLRQRTLAQAVLEGECSAIDWTDGLPAEASGALSATAFDAVLNWEEAATRALTAERASAIERNDDAAALLAQLAASRNPYEQVEILGQLRQRHGAGFELGSGATVGTMTEAIYARAGHRRLWGVLRRAAGALELLDESLEDGVAQIVMRQKRISVGRSDSADAVIARPCGNAEIAARLRAHGGADPRARVLIQEVVLLLATLIKADPALFEGTLTLRPWHLVLLIDGWLAREHGVTPAEAFDHLLDLSPQAILARLREGIAREQEMASNLLRQQWLHHSGGAQGLVQVSFFAGDDPVLTEAQGGWRTWREMTGVMTRVPADFHARVWELLRHCRGLVIGDVLDVRNVLDSALFLADTTAAEHGFALHVDDLLNKITEPAYRQLSIEALLAASAFCHANADLVIEGQLVIDVLLRTAVQLAADASDDESGAWLAFYASAPHRVGNFVITALERLLDAADAPAGDT